MKKILIYIVLVVVVFFGLLYMFLKNQEKNIVEVPEAKAPVEMCYQYSKETSRGYVDRVWLSQ